MRSNAEKTGRALAALALLLFAGAGCPLLRDPPGPTPSYQDGVSALLAERCGACHSGDEPAAGWRATTYIEVLACVEPSGQAAILPADESAPILAALDLEDHRTLLSDAERGLLTAWVRRGAPGTDGAMHDPSFADPRSSAFHGRVLRAQAWAPMLEPAAEGACGRCHRGAPASPEGGAGATNAPACTTCHDRPGGVLACDTCHGASGHAYPPRDPCFFPGVRANAHAAHVEPGSIHTGSYGCGTCHPPRGPSPGQGGHGDGVVDIAFDPDLAGPSASFDRTTGTCTVACHDQGGDLAIPPWQDPPELTCDSCHQSPPPSHFAGACSTCHPQLSGDGRRMLQTDLHLNGQLDVGDGTGRCGVCHGEGNDPWPSSGAHAAHREPLSGAPVSCGTCHEVPSSILAAGHIDREPGAEVVMTGRAAVRDASPVFDGEACSAVACHGFGNPGWTDPMPRWDDPSGAAAVCGACHGLPPAPPHPVSTTCESLLCHGAVVARDADGLRILESGRTLHINGVVDLGVGP